MKAFLDSVKQIDQLPDFYRVVDIELIMPKWREKCESIRDDQFKLIFNEISKSFFENISIPIFSCDIPGTSNSMKYGILFSKYELELINFDSKVDIAGLKFTIAHEIAHYVHEMSTMKLYAEEDGISLNGYHSYIFQSSFPECRRLGISNLELQDCQQESKLNSHSEVDIYAAIILKEMGFTDWNYARENWVTQSQELHAHDIHNLLIRINKRFDNIKHNIQNL